MVIMESVILVYCTIILFIVIEIKQDISKLRKEINSKPKKSDNSRKTQSANDKLSDYCPDCKRMKYICKCNEKMLAD